jgi:hypothetical protein
MTTLTAQTKEVTSFGPFGLVTSGKLLTGAGAPIELCGRAYGLLVRLLRNEAIAEDALRESEARLVKAEREFRLTLDTIPALACRTRRGGQAHSVAMASLEQEWATHGHFRKDARPTYLLQRAPNAQDRVNDGYYVRKRASEPSMKRAATGSRSDQETTQ